MVGKVTAMYDKVKAGIVAMETTATAEDGSLLSNTGSSVFIHGEGGCGGDRGPGRLPVGLQFIGKPFGEEELFQVAAATERAVAG